MTTLYRDPQGAFTLPETLRQGQAYQGGVVNFDTQTGKPLAQGGYTYSRPVYGDLAPGPQTAENTGGYVPPDLQQSNPSTVNFTTALIQMLKEAQGRDTTGQARLMKQSQNITGQGLNDAARNFNNPLLAPNSGTSLGLSAQNQFDPLQLSIANQQKLATQNLGNITDVLKQTGDSYEQEQDRLFREEESRLDRESRAEESRLDRIANAANKSTSFDTDAQIREFSGNMKKIKGADGYIDPYEWMAARDLWQSYGGSDATFETNFKRYLNPLSYKLAGYKEEATGITAKQQALIDALRAPK